MIKCNINEFLKQDKKEYILKNNGVFLQWLNEFINAGYVPSSTIEQFGQFIESVAQWYEFKLPERQLISENIQSDYYNSLLKCDIKSISKYMTVEQLFLRLSSDELNFLECQYWGDDWCERDELTYENIGKGYTISFFIKRENTCFQPVRFVIHIDAVTGVVLTDDEIVTDNIDKKNIEVKQGTTIEKLVDQLDKIYGSKCDFSRVRAAISKHNMSIAVRQKILELVALRLLYSENINEPIIGYIRAKHFIKDFNNQIPNLNLSTSEIDTIMKIHDNDRSTKTVDEEEYGTHIKR